MMSVNDSKTVSEHVLRFISLVAGGSENKISSVTQLKHRNLIQIVSEGIIKLLHNSSLCSV